MPAVEWIFQRLIEGGAISLVLFVAGSAAVVCCRQPVRRLRIILLTLVAAFVAPLVSLLPGLPHWCMSSVAEPSAPVPSVLKTDPLREPEILQAKESAAGAVSFENPPSVVSDDVPATVADLPAERPMDEIIELADDAARDRDLAFEDVAIADDPPPEAVPGDPEPATITRHEVATTVILVAIAPVRGPTPPVDARAWAVGVYLTVVAGFGAWWLFGLLCLWRLVRTASPAPAFCCDLLGEIAGPDANRVRLLVSARAAQPCTFAWRYPVIVIPAELLCVDAANSQLRFCLAHEFAHVARKDVWLWWFAGLLRLVYFYQPLCWWLRGQLRLCQDFLADAAAAKLESPETYAEFLATRAAGSPLALGLGIAGSQSELYRRVVMLVNSPFVLESRCSTRWTVAAACTALALTLFTATFGEQRQALAFDTTATSSGSSNRDAEPQEFLRDATSPIVALQGKSTTGTTGGKDVNAVAPDAAIAPAGRKRILESLATRTTRFAGGTIRFERQFSSPGDEGPPWGESLTLITQGQTWLLRSETGSTTAGGSSGGHGARPAMSGRGGAAMGGMGMPGMSSMRGGSRGTPAMPGMSGPSSQTASASFTLVDAGRAWQGELQESDPFANAAHDTRLQIARGSTLTVKHPEAVVNSELRQTPLVMGTIYYESGRRYIRDHAAAAQFKGMLQRDIPVLKDIPLLGNLARAEPRIQVVDWNVSEEDARAAFPAPNSFLQLGGVLRVYVVEELEDLVARIEGIDRFGTTQFSVAFFQPQVPKGGSAFPTRMRYESGEGQIEYLVTEVIPPNPKSRNLPQQLSIPVGVNVIDERSKKSDYFPEDIKNVPEDLKRIAAGASFAPNLREYPLHGFKTTAAYPEGFPPKLLAELDRDVLPWEFAAQLRFESAILRGAPMGSAGMMLPGMSFGMAETSNRTTGGKRGTKGAAKAKPAEDPASSGDDAAAIPSAVKKSASHAPIKAERYAGKTFSEWRKILIDDLDPDTRMKALEAIGALGANGYAGEAAAAIGDILLTGDSQANNDVVVYEAACEALTKLGQAGVGPLQAQLDGNSVKCRRLAVESVAALSRSVKTTLPLLMRAARDEDEVIRKTASVALLQRFSDGPEVIDTLGRIVDEDAAVRATVVTSIHDVNLPPEGTARLLKAALEDGTDSVRVIAALEFARRAPASGENIKRLTASLVEGGHNVRWQFAQRLNHLSKRKSPPPIAEGMIPALGAVVRSEYLPNDVFDPFVNMSVAVVGTFPQKTIQAAFPELVPVVTQILEAATDLNSPLLDRAQQLPTIILVVDLLGKSGSAAKGWLPPLKILRKLAEGQGVFAATRVQIPMQDLKELSVTTHEKLCARIDAAIRSIEEGE